MADITIPGVGDKYKTNDLIEGLMKVERVPLNREQVVLDKYKAQQTAWRNMNQKMTSLRETVKTLYSYDNPFNSKLSSSTQEYAITANADRDALCGDYKIDVLNPASADRFLSSEIDPVLIVPKGTYTYSVGEKTISMTWKGGKLSDFATALSKRAPETLKASVIGIGGIKKALLIESLKTGWNNALVFADDALEFAKTINMLGIIHEEPKFYEANVRELKMPTSLNSEELQVGMPPLTNESITKPDTDFVVPPRNGYVLDIPKDILSDNSNRIEFTIGIKDTEDITLQINESQMLPELPDVGGVEFEGVQVQNAPLANALPEISPKLPEELNPIDDTSVVFIQNEDGSVTNIPIADFAQEDGSYKVDIDVANFKELKALEVHNINTGKSLIVSDISYFRVSANGDLGPLNPVSKADDAVIKYEGITIARATNQIDDVIPNVTLNVVAPTERTATISIKPDIDSAKEALINFVGKYNQVIAQINILTQTKPEVVAELDYLSNDEQEEEMKKLGMFQGDSGLVNGKASMQKIITSVYKYAQTAQITMLSQIGISSKASGGSGYNPSQMRGYLEMDEKKLDASLENQMDQIKNIFGFDSDGDMIVDSGVAFALDRQLASWVQSGGLISNRTGTLDKQIKSSEQRIDNLEEQLAKKESQLKQKYGVMEGTLNSLQSQSNTISNFANQNQNNKK